METHADAGLGKVRFVVSAMLVLGLIDLVTTVFLLDAGLIVEANPVMAFVLHAGLVPFILVKLATLAAYALVIESYGRRYTARACFIGTATFLLYAVIYVIGFWTINYRCLIG